MSTKITVVCGSCNYEYVAYTSNQRESFLDCPACEAKMNREMFEKVIDGIIVFEDLHEQFYRRHYSEKPEPYFQVSFESILNQTQKKWLEHKE